MDTEGAKQYIKGKLMNQWIILDGDLNVIERIENSVYPPGTPKNSDFEVVMLSPFKRMFLAKKNDDLKAFLHNPPGFPDIIRITLARLDSSMVAGEVDAVRQGRNFAESVDTYVEMLFSELKNKHEKMAGVVKKCQELRTN